ncbi:fatty acid desaturase [Algiphilus sp.]|uniref:fatty acid desaturase n=1 Tax=Algiphilus sp. TaxID=1872431 RepID=UPI0025BDC9D3|nr:fatty acid desaturase [Algiphilus sp.]MCK5771161.1 fatty acid desaturase [Algiphilus sp.]
MSQTTYPRREREALEQIVSKPAFRRIHALPLLAWQEVLLVAGCYGALVGSCYLHLTGGMPYAVALAINALAIYAIFTPLHDAAHGSLSSNRRVNDLIGTVAALPLFPGFTAQIYRYLHLEHHRHTGVAHRDPDEIMVSARMPWRLLVLAGIDLYWMVWYARRLKQRPIAEVASAAASAVFFIAWHVLWLTSPFAWQFVLLWLIPQRIGLMLLTYTFAAIQHPEGVPQAERPLQATRMFRGGWLMRWMTLSQSQHLMHHMFPAVPYYRYNAAWKLAEPELRDHEIVWDWPVGPLHHPEASPLPSSELPLRARIVEAAQVSEAVRAYLLEPAEASPFPAYSAGAHIDVEVAPGHIRQYSLVGAPRADGRYRIGVKREDHGRGGSLAVHEGFAPGRVIRIGVPRNRFPLEEAAAGVVLVAGGIGITPLLAMADALHAKGTPFTLHACARSRGWLPFREELLASPFAEQLRVHLSDDPAAPRLCAADLPEWRAGQHMYLCGPEGFMAHVTELAGARGWPSDAIHTESFATAAKDAATEKPFTVTLARSGKRLQVPAESSLLEVLHAHNYPVPSVCTQGLCGTCSCTVIEGEVDHRDAVLSPEERQAGRMTTCVSRAVGEGLLLDL